MEISQDMVTPSIRKGLLCSIVVVVTLILGVTKMPEKLVNYT